MAPRTVPNTHKDPYGALGVDSSASAETVRESLKQLVRQQDSEHLSRYPTFYSGPMEFPLYGVPTVLVDSGSDDSRAPSPLAPRHHSDRQHLNRGGKFGETGDVHKVTSDQTRPKHGQEKSGRKTTDLSSSSQPSSSKRTSPHRPQPASQSEATLPAHSQSSSMPQPAQPFQRVVKPRKSALKKPSSSTTPLPVQTDITGASWVPEPTSLAVPYPRRNKLSRPGHPSRPDLAPASPATSSILHPAFALSPPTTESNFSRSSNGTTLLSTPSVPPSTFGSSQSSSVGVSIPSESGSPHSIQHPLPSWATLHTTNPDPDSDLDGSPKNRNAPQAPVHSNLKRRPNDNVPPVPPLPAQYSRGHESGHRGSPPSPRTPGAKSTVSKSGNGTFTLPSARKPVPPPPSESGTESSVDSPPASPRRSSRDLPKESIPKEWIYPLPLTLEQLFHGGSHQFRITQHMLNGSKREQKVNVDVQPGWKTGTRVVFPGVGNERTDGSFQDVIFIVEQLHHEKFARLDGGRLVLNLDIELADALKNKGRPARRIKGLDARTIEFHPPPGIIKNGMQTVLRGKGMPIRSKSKVVGRGDLIISWSVRMPEDMTPGQVETMRRLINPPV